MTFSFLHSRHEQPAISIPQIGLDLRVRVRSSPPAVF